MLPAIGAALIGAGVSGIGMGLQNTRRKQQMADQKELMQQQQENQMALNRQGQQLAQENWDYTNAENQRKHYEKAGLNVGLMYGGSGAGGTLSSGSGGGASGGNAPTNQLDTSGLGMQLQQMALLKAQKENIEADTNKKNVEANKLGGADTNNTIANTELTKMKLENEKIQNNIANKTIDEIILQVKANADKAQSEQRSALVKANVDENTQKSAEEKIEAEAKNEAFKLAVMKSGIQLNEAQMNNMKEQIRLGEFNAEKIGLDQVKGKALNQAYEAVMRYFGVKNKALK